MDAAIVIMFLLWMITLVIALYYGKKLRQFTYLIENGWTRKLHEAGEWVWDGDNLLYTIPRTEWWYYKDGGRVIKTSIKEALAYENGAENGEKFDSTELQPPKYQLGQWGDLDYSVDMERP